MAPRAQLSVPTNGALPHGHRLPSTNPEVSRTISRLSRQSLISLALQWLHKKHRAFCEPYLTADYSLGDADIDDAPYDPAQSCEELQEMYEELQGRKGGRKEVAERILEGDWRHGLSLYQLAMAETKYLLDHPTSLRWSAQRLAKIENSKRKSKGLETDNSANHLPRFHAQTFLLNLVHEVSPLVKAHYYLTRINSMPLTLLRVYIHDSPYSTEKSLHDTLTTPHGSSSSDGSKSIFLVFPDGSPFTYVSTATGLGQTVGVEGRSLRKVVLDAVPKALSKPAARYTLQPTSLSARSLSALLAFRGPGRSNAAAGGWSIFAANSLTPNALDFALGGPDTLSSPSSADADAAATANKENDAPAAPQSPSRKRAPHTPDSPASKRRKQVAAGRFGRSARQGDGQGIERLDVRIDDAFPALPASVTAAAAAAVAAQALPALDPAPSQPAKQPSKRPRRSRASVLDRPEGRRGTAGADADVGAEGMAWCPDVRISFQGAHVFAGIRQLVERGVVDGEAMPGWMTGEAGVSIGVVREGRMLGRGEGGV